MKTTLKFFALVMVVTMMISMNLFTSAAGPLENVCLNKYTEEITGTYWEIEDYQTFLEATGQEDSFAPPAFTTDVLVDGVFDSWGTDRFVTVIPMAAIEIDLGGEYLLETLRTSYLYSTEANGESPSKETTVQVSSDGENWTTVIDKQPLSVESDDLVKLLDSTMHIYATEFDLGGVTASMIRVAYHNTETEQGFNLMEIACYGRDPNGTTEEENTTEEETTTEAPATTVGDTSAPDTNNVPGSSDVDTTKPADTDTDAGSNAWIWIVMAAVIVVAVVVVVVLKKRK